ncbi:MAG: iron ABC transporter permease [Myxococcota bacterium]|jgi:iron complex transport system permease protein|nr:iron ABC transporter permease [Myxococcota bacterium]
MMAIWALLVALVMSMLVAAGIGAVELDWVKVASLVTERVGIYEADASLVERSVFWVIRAPRILLAVLVGGALGLSGAALQGIFRNPLADPGLIGVSSGAALCVVGAIVFGAALSLPVSPWFIPLAAFVGAILATVCVLQLATRGSRVDVATMLLAGIAINALAGAFIGFATYIADDAQLRSLTMWSLGSLGGAGWREVGLIALFTIPGAAMILRQQRALDLLLLGEREAGHLGIDVTRTRRIIIAACALMVGVGVGFTGIIGFVGLVVPHVLRLAGGAAHRWVLPGSLLGGAILLLAADTLARTIAAPAELPIGVLTSLVGAPFFLALLLGQRRRAIA